MISLLPLGTKGKNLRSSEILDVRSHEALQKRFMKALEDVNDSGGYQLKDEQLILNSDSPGVKLLVDLFDYVLSNGLLRGNRLYWYFVKEFLSKEEMDYFKNEWKATNVRDSSVAWLKDSLNRNLIFYYFKAFLSNWTELCKHYHKSSLMRNYSFLERMTKEMECLNNLRFEFEMPIREDAPIAEWSRSTAASKKVVFDIESDEQLSSSPRDNIQPNTADHAENHSVLIDIVIPPDLLEVQPPIDDEHSFLTATDRAKIFGEMLSHKDSSAVLREQLVVPWVEPSTSNEIFPSGSRKENDELSNSQDNFGENSTESSNPYDAALKQSISKAKFFAEQQVAEDKVYYISPVSENLETSVVGEVQLDTGEIIGLSLNVFKDEAERFLRFYQVFNGFQTGHPEQRFLILTNRAVYLLSMTVHASSLKSYIVKAYLPVEKMLRIEVSHDYEVLYFYGLAENLVNDTSNTLLMEVCTACSQLGSSILEELKGIYERYHRFLPDGPRSLSICMKSTRRRYLERFIGKNAMKENDSLRCYCLTQWLQRNPDGTSRSSIQHYGYLYHKTLSRISWLKRAEEYQQSYFHLQNKKLYQFADSSCKFGERVISILMAGRFGSNETDFRDMVKSVSVVKTEISPYMFEITLQSREVIQFICLTADDLNKWISLLNLVISSVGARDDPVACFLAITDSQLLIAQEGENFAVDGFVRLLDSIKISNKLMVKGVFTADRYACVINDGSKLNWFLLRSPNQVDRILRILSDLGIKKISSEEDGTSRFSSVLSSIAQSTNCFYFTDKHDDNAFVVYGCES